MRVRCDRDAMIEIGRCKFQAGRRRPNRDVIVIACAPRLVSAWWEASSSGATLVGDVGIVLRRLTAIEHAVVAHDTDATNPRVLTRRNRSLESLRRCSVAP